MGRGAGGSGGGGGGFDRGGGAFISRERILAANKAGMNNPNDYNTSYYTPAMQVAFEAGQKGIDLSKQPDVTGYRYGKAPDSGISTNYAEGRSERGLSLANLKGGKKVGSTIWFEGRKRYKYTGLLLPWKGSDGEPLIISYQTRYDD